MCVFILSHSLEKRRKHNTNQSVLSLFTQNRLLSCVSSSVAMSFFFLFLCCRKRIMAAPRTEKHAKYTTLNPRVSATAREITFIMGYTISMWSSTSSALDVHLPGIRARTRSFDLFVCCWSSSGFECGLICMIRHMQMSRVLLWPCVLLCCECPRTHPLIRTCLQRHHCLFVVVICHTL